MSKFNVLHHDLVPEHDLVDEKDEAELLKKLKTQKDFLPKISIKDPAIEALSEIYGEIKTGRIIKITRKVSRDDKTVGIAEYYRVVSNEVMR
ncbi:DNA-directed RNA polymerase subunit RpoH/Rpb5 C-terminal domain-containing protein [Cuniculiplasma sp. SKW4]|uniref:DNA-directed RNA polymerase subunit RpoH/Rpb5 C-terminal domain-containing protein n=1 Tax=Cuniculiplasma sp. SKW4 TaxID=3400171 RepID=UPI003FCFFE14